MITNGIFITLEGGEGAGKTTILPYIQKYFEGKKLEVVTTREPGGIDIAEKIRAIILDRNHDRMDARTEALLYAAARRQHLVEKVIPTLKEGKVVICDRFIDSSLAYQGFARGLGIEEIYQINQFAVEECMPNLTLFLDIPPEIGFSRIHANQNREVNRLDLENREFHHKVREGYFQLLKAFPHRLKAIDAQQPIELVVEQIVKTIQQVLGV